MLLSSTGILDAAENVCIVVCEDFRSSAIGFLSWDVATVGNITGKDAFVLSHSRFRGKKEGKLCHSAALWSKPLAFVPLLGRKENHHCCYFHNALTSLPEDPAYTWDVWHSKAWWNNGSQCFFGFCKCSAFWKPAFLFVLVGFAQGIWALADSRALRVLHGVRDCPSLGQHNLD